jgi:ATP-dependent Clp protease ATP-binding subunit ClpX
MEKSLSCSFCGKGRHEVDQMIEGPQHSGISLYICNECVDYSHQVIHEVEEVKPVEKPKLLTPEEIKAELDKYIVGQDESKVGISVAIYNHYKRINNPQPDIEIEKSNLLMIGPSGSGKTLMVKTIAKMFDLPYVIADATAITETGYVGEDADTLIEKLLQNANGDIERAQKGIIFIDEIDKKSRKGESSTVTRDVSGVGVQQALLKLIEGTVLRIVNALDRMETAEFDTKNILFICSGAFIGLDEVMRETRQTAGIGINAEIKDKEKSTKIIKSVTPEDLIKYGLIPEFVGRCPLVLIFDDLDNTTLVRILTEPKNSIISQFKALFKIEGVDLEFNDKYLQFVADECLRQKIGARGLRGIIEKTLQDTQFILPKLAANGVSKIVVDGQGMTKNIYKNTKKRVNDE